MENKNQNDQSAFPQRDEREEQLERMKGKFEQQNPSPNKTDSADILKPLRKKILFVILGLLVINLIFVFVDNHESMEPDLAGNIHSGWDTKRMLISTLTINCAILSLIVGALLSLIPYKNLEYKRKYLFFCLVAFLLIQLFFFLFETRNLLLGYH